MDGPAGARRRGTSLTGAPHPLLSDRTAEGFPLLLRVHPVWGVPERTDAVLCRGIPEN